MTQLRIAFARLDTANGAPSVEVARRAAAHGAHLVVFSGEVRTGRSTEDLRRRAPATAGCGELPTAVLHRGRLSVHKAGHAVGAASDASRCGTPGDRLPVLRLRGLDVALVRAEDLLGDDGVVTAARAAGVRLLVVLDAAPYERAEAAARLELCARRAREAGTAVAYCRLGDRQGESVAGDEAFGVTRTGELLPVDVRFDKEMCLADLALPEAPAPPRGAYPAPAVQPWRLVPGLPEDTSAHPSATPLAVRRLALPTGQVTPAPPLAGPRGERDGAYAPTPLTRRPPVPARTAPNRYRGGASTSRGAPEGCPEALRP